MPIIKVKDMGDKEACKCNNCSNVWFPNNIKELPLVCPKCKSSRWNKDKKK